MLVCFCNSVESLRSVGSNLDALGLDSFVGGFRSQRSLHGRKSNDPVGQLSVDLDSLHLEFPQNNGPDSCKSTDSTSLLHFPSNKSSRGGEALAPAPARRQVVGTTYKKVGGKLVATNGAEKDTKPATDTKPKSVFAFKK